MLVHWTQNVIKLVYLQLTLTLRVQRIYSKRLLFQKSAILKGGYYSKGLLF